MQVDSPSIEGALSECSRYVIFKNAIHGAKVILVRIRNGISQHVGSVQAKQSSGVVELIQSEEFLENDLVTVLQEFGGKSSPPFGAPIEIQKSNGKINPPQVCSTLYECSHGFHLGSMIPGTRVEVLNGSNIIGKGISIDGTAYVNCTPHGLPAAGNQLTIRQRLCPKPPPPGGAVEWIQEDLLPPVESYQEFPSGSEIPAPTITKGLYDCSRSIEVSNIIPGFTVLVKDTNGDWWASLGPSNNTSGSLSLPIGLIQGRKVEVIHQCGERCREEWRFASNTYVVGPQQQLPKPSLDPIVCNTVPVLITNGLKDEADVEIEVKFTDQGQLQTQIIRSQASEDKNTEGKKSIPAPQMPKESTVRIRQGECNVWSAWSDSQTIPATHEAPHKPKIEGELFKCQNSITVSDLYPVGGTLCIKSKFRGEIDKKSIMAETMTFHINPSLDQGDEVWAKHDLCGDTADSGIKPVYPINRPGIGQIKGPIFDGDTILIVQDVTVGAFIEIWDLDPTNNKKRLLTDGKAPSSGNANDKVNVEFSGFSPLKYRHHIYATFMHCGHNGRNDHLVVEYHPPVLQRCVPPSFQRSADYVGSTFPISLTAFGSHFRPGAKIIWDYTELNTNFRSNNPPQETSLETWIDANISNVVKKYNVQVKNDDGKISNIVQVEMLPLEEPKGPVTPPPPETPKPFIAVTVEAISGSDSTKKIIIGGSGFKHNEDVIIFINQKPKSTYPNGVDDNLIESDSDTETLFGNKADGIGALGQLPNKIEHIVLYSIWSQSMVKIKVKGNQSGDSNVTGITV
ncbi:hypothetical protein V7652_28495 [Bacillus thuringiensis]|uniref:hypothetical protein n=1 Tax=Bacillus thuringiensis TaxID=1428 RepID=UPI000BF4A233|nr:hypothetical protein [Bacillus thuringiensis]MED3622352.1 hypothetical protein [Bacillus thuringiensis]PEW78980.1 hypothetical protein CN447_30860 [Bacillus thuringiensis]